MPVSMSLCRIVITSVRLRPSLEISETMSVSPGSRLSNSVPSFLSLYPFRLLLVSSTQSVTGRFLLSAHFSISNFWFSVSCLVVDTRMYPYTLVFGSVSANTPLLTLFAHLLSNFSHFSSPYLCS